MSEISVCIAICSRRRPVLLKRALTTLSKLNIPAEVSLKFLLVENDDKTQYRPLVDEMADRLNITYVTEPVAGLSYARNKVIDTATEMGVDWLGCVDDDQIIDPGWLEHMIKAVRAYPETAMFVGKWVRTNPAGTPPWYPALVTPKKHKTGTKMSDGVGGNAFIRADVFSPDGMALRYDHEYRFLGGEDTDFSLQYRKKGGIIRNVREAVTTEEIPKERNGLPGRMERIVWMQAVLAKLRHRYHSTPIALLLSLQIVYQGVVLGIAYMFVGFLALPFNEHWGLKRYGVGRRYWARAHGVLRYYFGGPLDEPYRTTLGN